MKLYRKIAGTVEAVQYNGTNDAEVRELLGAWPLPPAGYYVVRRSGGLDVVSPDTFAASYEPVL